MFQTLPSANYYKEIERYLARNGKPTSLTFEELKAEFDGYQYSVGYKTYTGYELTQADVNVLNNYTREINSTRCIASRHLLLDKRHQMFCIIAEQLNHSQIARKS